MSFISWLEGLANIGDDIIAAAGTIVAAMLGAAVGVLTWVLTARKDRERDRKERADSIKDLKDQKIERINDIVRALHAEILTGIVLYERQMQPDEVRNTVRDRAPFATPDETDFIFDSVRSEISILPSEVIHTVVAYYRSAQQTNLIIRDFRDQTFKALSPREKEKFLKGYIALTGLLKKRGDRAVEVLADYARRNAFSLDGSQRQIREDTKKAMADTRELIRASAARKLASKRSNDRKNRTRHG